MIEGKMKYTVVLTEQSNGSIHAAVPGLPECAVLATNRVEALNMIRETISEIISRSEIIQIDVTAEPKSGVLLNDTPWEWFGAFKNDSTWEELFDEIECQRNSD